MIQKLLQGLLIVLFIFIIIPQSFAKGEINYNHRMIEIACLPHTTFSNENNLAKIVGAIEMRSTDEDFGGISALVLLRGKPKAYLLTDRASFIVADVVKNQKTNAIDCFRNALIRPLRGRSTNPLNGHYADSEGMSLDNDGLKVLISFERHHRVAIYNPSEDRLLPRREFPPFSRQKLPFNESYESVLRLKDKSVIAFPERHEIQEAVLQGFLLLPNGRTLKNLYLKRLDGFWLTDIAELANGDFLTLERSFNIFAGMATQMRHIKRAVFLSGKVADGDIIFSMKSGDGVDNFEGMDILPQADGSNMIYISSDNNFSDLQKTLLLSLYYNPQAKNDSKK